MLSMINKDMHHMLGEAIKDEDPTRIYNIIQEHFKGGKNHHVESARRKLNAHRFGPDVERGISRLLVLISELEVAQKMDMPESQKFGILRSRMSYEERPHVRNIFGMAYYIKENFYNTVIKIFEEWDTIPTDKNQALMAASMAPQVADRICFKFQTNECVRPKCPFIHKIMTEQERKDQNYVAKVPEKKNFTGKHMKGTTIAKKFKGKQDMRNNNSKETNGMHNNIPLTKEHQMMLGEGEVKPTPGNPRGFSKRQLTVLSLFKDREVKNNINQSNDDGHFSSWRDEKNSFRGIENNYKNGFNLNLFKSSTNEVTPSREPVLNEVEESTLMRRALGDIARIAREIQPSDIVVHSNTFQINSIVKLLDVNGRLCPWTEENPHQFPTNLPKGFHVGSDEVMLALYKINEAIFGAIVMYPFKVFNFESGSYEHKKNSFMRFIPHERKEHYKIFHESGFYRSTVDSIPIYFKAFSRIQNDPSADDKDKDLFVFAMDYDFMSYVAQQFGGYLETGISLKQGRKNLMEVIVKCDEEFRCSNWIVSNGMIAIGRESYPEPKYIKDVNSDYQVQRSVTWSDYTSRKKHLTAIKFKELL